MLIEATDLRVVVGRRELFTALSFRWEAPGLVAVIGPSGSGKSTLLSMIMGWTRPTGGSLAVEPTAGTWLVPQNAPLLDSRNVRDNLKVALLSGSRPGESANEVDAVVETFHLHHCATTLARHLSGGERQRVALAMAALRNPQILLADEVTSGLDYVSVDKVCAAMREVATRTLVVTATHDERVWSTADHVLNLATVSV